MIQINCVIVSLWLNKESERGAIGLHKEGGRREGRKEDGREETRKNCSGSSPEIPTQTQCIALFQGKSLFQASGTTQVFGGGGLGVALSVQTRGF